MAKVTTSSAPTSNEPAAETTAKPKTKRQAFNKAQRDELAQMFNNQTATLAKLIQGAQSSRADEIESIPEDTNYEPSMNAEPERKVVTAELDDWLLRTPSKEEIESWPPEKVQMYNQAQADRIRERKRELIENRKKFAEMPRGERNKILNALPPEGVIRESINPLDERMVEVVANVRIALNEAEMCVAGETIKLPLSKAREYQEQGKIQVTL